MSALLSMIVSRLRGVALWLALVAVLGLIALLAIARARRLADRAEHLAERLSAMETITHVQTHMLEAAARRPRDRNDLADRLRDGRF